jgi:glycosyltransferase involved in cell wall biosynthesis
MRSAPVHLRHLIGSLDRGGAEQFLVRLVTGIATREPAWRQSVWTLSNNVPLAPDLQRAGVEVRTFDGGKSLAGILQLAGVPRAMASEPCSLLQCWMYHAEVMGVISRMRGARAPQVWTLRQSRLSGDANTRMTRLLMRISARASRYVPAAIVAGSQAALEAHRTIGYRAPLMPTIHNGVDVAHFAPNVEVRARRRAAWGLDADTIAIGYLARISPVKAHDDLLAAVARLIDTPGLPPWRLVLVGSGTGRGEEPLASMIRDAGLNAYVICAAVDPDPAAALTGFDIAVSSSLGEGFPNAVAEGMATGIPTVATDVGDTRSLLGDSPYLVPPAQPERLAAAITALLRLQPNERRALGDSLRRRVQENFDIDSAIDAYAALYRQVISGAASGGSGPV